MSKIAEDFLKNKHFNFGFDQSNTESTYKSNYLNNKVSSQPQQDKLYSMQARQSQLQSQLEQYPQSKESYVSTNGKSYTEHNVQNLNQKNQRKASDMMTNFKVSYNNQMAYDGIPVYDSHYTQQYGRQMTELPLIISHQDHKLKDNIKFGDSSQKNYDSNYNIFYDPKHVSNTLPTVSNQTVDQKNKSNHSSNLIVGNQSVSFVTINKEFHNRKKIDRRNELLTSNKNTNFKLGGENSDMLTNNQIQYQKPINTNTQTQENQHLKADNIIIGREQSDYSTESQIISKGQEQQQITQPFNQFKFSTQVPYALDGKPFSKATVYNQYYKNIISQPSDYTAQSYGRNQSENAKSNVFTYLKNEDQFLTENMINYDKKTSQIPVKIHHRSHNFNLGQDAMDYSTNALEEHPRSLDYQKNRQIEYNTKQQQHEKHFTLGMNVNDWKTQQQLTLVKQTPVKHTIELNGQRNHHYTDNSYKNDYKTISNVYSSYLTNSKK